MLSVTQLANKFNISRTTILYYERKGLMEASFRTQSGYRQYGKKEIDRLEKIISYRSLGVPVQEILCLITNENENHRETILREQFSSLDLKIQNLRQQQASIVAILRDPSLLENKLMNKQQWIDVLRVSGLDEQGMINWHKQFEQLDPMKHQLFLESLGIDKQEIQEIRKWSKE